MEIKSGEITARAVVDGANRTDEIWLAEIRRFLISTPAQCRYGFLFELLETGPNKGVWP